MTRCRFLWSRSAASAFAIFTVFLLLPIEASRAEVSQCLAARDAACLLGEAYDLLDKENPKSDLSEDDLADLALAMARQGLKTEAEELTRHLYRGGRSGAPPWRTGPAPMIRNCATTQVSPPRGCVWATKAALTPW
jgi:hypothetical protein